MTDAEKMLETMIMMGKAASKNQQTELDMAAQSTKMLYDSYVKAGFTRKDALDLVKELLKASIMSGKKN